MSSQSDSLPPQPLTMEQLEVVVRRVLLVAYLDAHPSFVCGVWLF